MKTLLRQPCPNCGNLKLHKTFDRDVAFCAYCFTDQFIGTLPDLERPQGKGSPGRIKSAGVKLK